MHARSPRSEIHCDVPVCLCFHLYSETCTKLQKVENPPWESSGRVADHFRSLQTPADHFLLLKTKKSGRPATFSGWPTSCCYQTPIFCSREQEMAWQCICKVCVHNHPPYHFSNSRECGTRLSGHQSRISMHDGQKAKFAQFNVNECINNS